jgi:hypothetical protein
MTDINHRVGIKATPESVYEALTTDDGLTKWWTNDISGAGEVGSAIEFVLTVQAQILLLRNSYPIKLFAGSIRGIRPSHGWVQKFYFN